MEKDKDKDKEELFIKENSIIFKKYKVQKKLGEGAFGDVYSGIFIENNESVAIKVESRKTPKPLLETEAFFLYSLKGLGIPEVLSFGRLKNYNVLIEPLLGKSLFDIFNERRKRLPIEDICLISTQIIDRIQWVHSKNIVHRDIKPDNFLIGNKDPNIIYLIDFGLSKKYKSSKTGKHIKFSFTGKLTGTVRFASANALRGGEQSRRDDLESIGYMIIYFMRGKLPWQGVTGNKKMERYLKIYKMKKNVAPEDLCKSLPKQMTEFMKYIKQLEFEQEPDYKYLRNLFKSILKKINGTSDQLLFSWIRQADLPNLKNPVNPATRRDSPQSRLYRKIQKNLNNGNNRNNSSDNDSGQNSFQTCTTAINPNMGIIQNNSKDTDIETTNKKLKSKDGLNTMVANINKTLDEKFVEDYGKASSNDTGPVSMMPGDEIKNKEKKKKNLTVNENINYKNENKEQNSNYNSFSKKKSKSKINNINDKSDEKIEKTNFEEKKLEIKPIKSEDNINRDKDNDYNLISNNNNYENNILTNNKVKKLISKSINNENDNNLNDIKNIIHNNNDNNIEINNDNNNNQKYNNNEINNIHIKNIISSDFNNDENIKENKRDNNIFNDYNISGNESNKNKITNSNVIYDNIINKNVENNNKNQFEA